MSLTFKERELANIGASVATGCKPCTDYHFEKVRKAGASENEIKQAISIAKEIRDSANRIMESHGLKHLGITKDVSAVVHTEKPTRNRELVAIAAAFAVNCTTSVKTHIGAAHSIGISEEDIPNIFEPFFTRKDPGSGTGLGLAITHEIIRAHQGRISVSSEVGTGTEFKFSFPVNTE